MPVTLNESETTQVQTASAQNITTIRVSNIQIDVDGQLILVEYSKGYMEGENFIRLKRGRGRIDGNAFLTLASSMADGNKSMYDNIKDAVYAQLIAQGDFAGVIS